MRRAGLLSTLLLGACLNVPDGPAPECHATSDCDSASGEVCQEGTCWGNPPAGTFAAVISPPSDHKDLVPREIGQVVISSAGWLNDLQLEVPVTFTAKLTAVCTPPLVCDRGAFSATATVTRPSQFHGGPGFKAVVASDASVDGATFSVALPRTNATDTHYTLTVVPDGRGPEPLPMAGPTPAELVPPLRLDLAVASTAATQQITVGGVDLPQIDGTVMSSTGGVLGMYRVVALGRWEPSAPATEVSTVDYTGADGKFHLVLSKDLVGGVELVARPFATGVIAPTLHLPVTGLPSTGTIVRTLVQPQAVGGKATVAIPVMGVNDGGGEVGPVRGARVRVIGSVPPAQPGGTTATYAAEVTTDANGIAKLELLDGAAIKDRYKLEVVPPASATVGVLYDRPFTLASPGMINLTSRIAIRGVVRDIHGDPIKDVQVTARPSLRFIWSLTETEQAFVTAIPASTTVTPSTGEFVLWVDPNVANTWGHYDLVFEPSSKSRAPTWVQPEVEIPRMQQANVLLPELRLPDAAFVHGTVTDAYGTPVTGSEVKLFRVETNLALCSEVSHAPASCPIPAVLEGRGASDDAGVVRLTLPR